MGSQEDTVVSLGRKIRVTSLFKEPFFLLPLPNRASQGYQDLLILCLHDTNRVTSLHSAEDRSHSRNILLDRVTSLCRESRVTIFSLHCVGVTSPYGESSVAPTFRQYMSKELPPHVASFDLTALLVLQGELPPPDGE